MGARYARLALVTVLLLQFSTVVSAGPLDDYYLQQFGETGSTQLQKAVMSVLPEAEAPAQCGMPLKHSLKRDWDLLEQTTQKTLAKQLALPTLAGEATFTSSGGHFKVHYATTGTDAPPLTDVTGIIGAPDWVETVAATFENVYSIYVAQGYRPAPTLPAGVPYDVYLLDLAPQRFYGVTNSGQSAPSAGVPNAVASWMEIDNNFTDSVYRPATFTPLQSLQITAAHEYHHAVQYGYNFFFDIWYAEATSTWMEDELYDGVNQLYSYIAAWFTQSNLSLDTPVSLITGGGYGRWIFNRYLSEKHGPAMIRNVWEKVAGLASPGGNADIPMSPVLDSVLSSTFTSTLGSDFLDFAKRVYTRAWSTHQPEIPSIHSYTPLASFSAIPFPANTTPAPAVTLPHYSFAYYRFVPSSGAPSDLEITITGTSGIKATAFRKNGTTIDEFPFSAVNGQKITVTGFNTSSEVVLLIANATSSDNHSANFSTDGTGLPVTEPSGGTVYPPLLPAASPATSSGGSGCFIATAAYGSYLHPQVQLLRNFRDDYLLTNAPGRAFVALYYRCSPPLADLIARHAVLRGAARLALTPLVVAVAHPLASAASLFLLAGALLVSRLRRINTARLKADPYAIRTT